MENNTFRLNRKEHKIEFECSKIWIVGFTKKYFQQEQERQEDIYECPNCLGEVHKNYIYCPFCGRKVESDDE